MNAPSSTPNRPLLIALAVSMRPRQWLKNVLVFAAPLAAGSILEPSVLVPSIIAFIAFCLVSSSTYLINDARDVAVDREHPVKRYRPIAAGQVSVRLAWIAAIVLLLASLYAASTVNLGLVGVVSVYFVFTLSYSLLLKHEPVIELALLAMGFLLRAIAGGVAAQLPISQWFLIVAAFGSLFMAAGKRYSELERAVTHTDEADRVMRKALAGYTLGYLRFVWATAAAVTIMGYALWAFEVAQAESSLPFAEWSVLPFVLAILRYGVVVDKGQAEAPEDAVLGDRVLLVLGVAWLLLFGLGALGV